VRLIVPGKLPAGEYTRKHKDVLEAKLQQAKDNPKEEARLRLDLLGEYYDVWRHTLEKEHSRIPSTYRDAVWKHYEALLLYFEESTLEEDNRI
jgi:hypothetical protein